MRVQRTRRLDVLVSDAELKLIEEYRDGNRHDTIAAAVRDMIRRQGRYWQGQPHRRKRELSAEDKLRRYAEAVEVLERAKAISKACPEVHYQLFLAYSRLKRQAEAEREQAIFKELEAAGITRQRDQSCEPDNRDLPSAFAGKPEASNR